MRKAIVILMGLFSFSACNGQSVESYSYNLMLKTLLAHSVDEIGVDSLSKNVDEYILLDARESAEFRVSHIPGALHVGYDEFDSTAVLALPRDAKIVVYCSVGYRSEKTTEKLLKMGFTDVANLYGGIFEWVNQGHAVVNAAGETPKVHAYSKSWGVWLKKGEKVY